MGFGSRFSLTLEGQDHSSRHWGIFATAKTGYVVLRIEPGDHGRQSRPSSLRYGASSAFPMLTGVMTFQEQRVAGVGVNAGIKGRQWIQPAEQEA